MLSLLKEFLSAQRNKWPYGLRDMVASICGSNVVPKIEKVMIKVVSMHGFA